MSWEKVNDSVESLQKGFADYKTANEDRLAKIEEGKNTGNIDAELKKRDENFDALESKFEKAVASMNRAKMETEVSTGEAEKELKSLGRKLLAKGELSGEENARFNELNGEEYKLLSVQNDNDGGYAVRPTISNNIQKRLFETSPMRQLAEVITIGSDRFEELYDNDEVDSGWVGETQERSETASNKLNKIIIPVHEIFAEPKATQKVLDDSFFDLESWHQGKVSEKFGRQENTSFISGDGILKPKGILAYAEGDGFDKLERVLTAGSGVIAGDDLVEMQTTLFEEYQMNASWMMKRAVAGTIRKLKDNDGRYLFSIDPSAGLNGAAPFMLLGRALRYANDMEAISAGNAPIAYGDFRAGYKIVDRVGMRVIRDAITQKGFVKFYSTKRVGGGVQQFQAIKLLKVKA